MNTLDLVMSAHNWRYATKKFDPSRKIDETTWKAIESSLILTPSSYGLQPWKFVIVQNPSLRQELLGHSWKQNQVVDCSHLVVFLAKEKMDEDHIDSYIQSIVNLRGVNAESLEGYKKMMVGDLVKGGRSKVIEEWATNQVYIALGNLMTTCALLSVDACPMEGIVPSKYDEVLKLSGSGFKTKVVCPIGYRSSDDTYQNLKKVRFDQSRLVQYL